MHRLLRRERLRFLGREIEQIRVAFARGHKLGEQQLRLILAPIAHAPPAARPLQHKLVRLRLRGIHRVNVRVLPVPPRGRVSDLLPAARPLCAAVARARLNHRRQFITQRERSGKRIVFIGRKRLTLRHVAQIRRKRHAAAPRFGSLAWLDERGEKPYRIKQVFAWVHKPVASFDEMTDIKKGLRSTVEWYLSHQEWEEAVLQRPEYSQWLEKNYGARGERK